MTLDFRLQELSFRKLTEDVELSSFCCDKDDELGIDEFIHSEALDYQKGHYGVTYLFYHSNEIVGFVTVAMGSVRAKELPEEMETNDESRIKTFPSLLIGQLGVDNKYRKRNLGSILCDWCVGLAVELSDRIGCRYVSPVTNKNKIDFYRKCEFKTENPNKERIMLVRRVV